MKDLSKFIEVVTTKVARDKRGTWSQGSVTYLEAMYAELKEVETEIESEKKCYLEDELGDILWVYLCMLYHMENEGKIDVQSVFARAEQKYTERVNGIESGMSWEVIKTIQKERLAQEQQAIDSRVTL
ncbi:MazG domain-containing protein [Vibrio chagasii]|uniref:MazG nucleotide pyrophosphohydrolase domain-containing protein n=1 Tax=Vibrio TaxID=662 RepID=UPI001EFD4DA3|nr:MazG nucleotide pyrophosphohydrolase domain-containing protein [Vibrio chagasii]MCG9675312.1 nucleotide pyrophosphohydrolase [Vibrio chagasii]CAH6919864.1 MazG domain-containing protein [Vibrio chagasii]CAH6934734.1 MazG domain-containing protein [Vibrio chagasii]CAH6965716.1 MazG domain-containing protein [Vibrio chagasii]CAH6966909.1 MazG domain-containing protein [Vibrio chagasii]